MSKIFKIKFIKIFKKRNSTKQTNYFIMGLRDNMVLD